MPNPVSIGIGDLWLVHHLGIHPGHLGPLSLAIPPCVGTMSTGAGFGHSWGRNGESCVVVGPATTGRLAYWLAATVLAVYLSRSFGQHGLYASLIGPNSYRLKGVTNFLKIDFSFYAKIFYSTRSFFLFITDTDFLYQYCVSAV